ncbi:hypothetical protein BaRGS_00018261 [Batillaria attramentaria]|uniref:G-protein coupled receptors family 1 profile domain-containing protein n=1 Tax=Batillaria attramentaria TaxID=370345 RepID=A0ABD0KTH2_9CAEN
MIRKNTKMIVAVTIPVTFKSLARLVIHLTLTNDNFQHLPSALVYSMDAVFVMCVSLNVFCYTYFSVRFGKVLQEFRLKVTETLTCRRRREVSFQQDLGQKVVFRLSHGHILQTVIVPVSGDNTTTVEEGVSEAEPSPNSINRHVNRNSTRSNNR